MLLAPGVLARVDIAVPPPPETAIYKRIGGYRLSLLVLLSLSKYGRSASAIVRVVHELSVLVELRLTNTALVLVTSSIFLRNGLPLVRIIIVLPDAVNPKADWRNKRIPITMITVSDPIVIPVRDTVFQSMDASLLCALL